MAKKQTDSREETISPKVNESLKHGEVDSEFDCPDCGGDGLIDSKTICPQCNGTGKRRPLMSEVEVKPEWKNGTVVLTKEGSFTVSNGTLVRMEEK